MTIKYTDGKDADFISLCRQLDDFLNDLVGGEENRSEYVSYNTLQDIHHVWIAYENDFPVGCVSLKDKTNRTGEIKRVYVTPMYRRKGIAQKLFEELERTARQNGYTRLILETGNLLDASVHLYLKLGFHVIDNYEPYVNMPESVCFEKVIG
jgi:N-acetylglutamate synthase-like GNAT family acetyltransferase